MPVYRVTLEVLEEAPSRAAVCGQLENRWPDLSAHIVKLDELPERRQQRRTAEPTKCA